MNEVNFAKKVKAFAHSKSRNRFFDVREHGQYGEGHPFFSVHVAYSVIELKCLSCTKKRFNLSFMDNGDGLSERARTCAPKTWVCRHFAFGRRGAGWAAAGYTLFKGVNVLSKTFGEWIEHECMTPSLSADELKLRLSMTNLR